MKIMSHCNFGYFRYCEGLVKSIRHAGNKQHIILKLLDFTKEQQEHAVSRLKDIKDIDLDFIDSKEKDFWIPVPSGPHAPSAPLYDLAQPARDFKKAKKNRTFQLYTDCRPFLIYDVMKNYNDDLLAICANALVFTNLTDIEKVLKKKDFVFKERETWLGLKNIEHVSQLATDQSLKLSLEFRRQHARDVNIVLDPNAAVLQVQRYLEFKNGKLNLEQIVHLPVSRVCLLGTLGISNNPWTKETVETWKKYILQERKNGELFFSSFANSTDPDTYENDSFIRAYIEVGLSGRYGRLLTKKTNLWDGNIIDTTCTSDKIWFGKGSIKTGGGKDEAGKRYLKKLDSYIK